MKGNKSKLILTLLLTIIVACGIGFTHPIYSHAEEAGSETYNGLIKTLGIEGDGTELTPYKVSTFEQFVLVSSGYWNMIYNGYNRTVQFSEGNGRSSVYIELTSDFKADLSFLTRPGNSLSVIQPIYTNTYVEFNGFKITYDVRSNTSVQYFMYIPKENKVFLSDCIGTGGIDATIPLNENTYLFYVLGELRINGGIYSIDGLAESKFGNMVRGSWSVYNGGGRFFLNQGTLWGGIYNNSTQPTFLNGIIHGKIWASNDSRILMEDVTIYSRLTNFIYVGSKDLEIYYLGTRKTLDSKDYKWSYPVKGNKLAFHPELTLTDPEKIYIQKGDAHTYKFSLNFKCTDNIISRQLIYESFDGSIKKVIKNITDSDIVKVAVPNDPNYYTEYYAEYTDASLSVSAGKYYVKTVRENHGEEYSEKISFQVYDPFEVTEFAESLSVFYASSVQAYLTATGTGINCEWKLDDTVLDNTKQSGNRYYVNIPNTLTIGTHTLNVKLTDIRGEELTKSCTITVVDGNGKKTTMVPYNLLVNGFIGSNSTSSTIVGVDDFDALSVTYEWNTTKDYGENTPIIGEVSYEWNFSLLGEDGFPLDAGSFDLTISGSNKNIILKDELSNLESTSHTKHASVTNVENLHKYRVWVTVRNTVTINGSERYNVGVIWFDIDNTPHTHDYSLGGYSLYNSEQHKKLCSCNSVLNFVYEDHQWDSSKAVEATYTSSGFKVCSLCGYQEIIPAKVCTHVNKETASEIAATCTSVGITGYKYCKDCGEVLETGSEIAKLDHIYSKTWKNDADNHWKACDCGDKKDSAAHTFEWKIDKAATTTEEGSKHEECSVCGYKKDAVSIEKLTESHTHSYLTTWSKDKDNHWKECECGDKKDSAAHTFEWKIDKAASITEEGSKHEECTVCGYSKDAVKIEKVAADHTHSYSTTWSKDAENHWKVCECGDIAEKAVHTFDEGVVKTEATETTAGEKVYTCKVCGATKSEEIAKLTTTTTVTKGTVLKDSKKNSYVVLDAKKNTVSYKAPASTKSTSITVPATVKIGDVTYKVTKIDDKAFIKCTKLTKVTIGSNVTTIGASAFSGLKKLKTVTFGKNVTTIGSNAFKGCTALTTVKLNSKVSTIGTSAFSGCTALKSVTLSSSLTTIGKSAFYKCTALTKITIPAKCTKIGTTAFSGCKKLKTITIKSTKMTSKTISKSAFKGIIKSATIKVPSSKKKAYKTLFKSKGFTGTVK